MVGGRKTAATLQLLGVAALALASGGVQAQDALEGGLECLGLSMTVAVADGEVTMTAVVPADGDFHAFGFGSTDMIGSYAVVVLPSGRISERGLDEKNLLKINSDFILDAEITVTSVSVINGQLTVVATRQAVTGGYFNFPETAGDVDMVCASGAVVEPAGDGEAVMSYHGSSKVPAQVLALAQVVEPAASASADATCVAGEHSVHVQMTRGAFHTQLVMRWSRGNKKWFGVGFGGDGSASGMARMENVWAIVTAGKDVQERILGAGNPGAEVAEEDASLTTSKLVTKKGVTTLTVTRPNTAANGAAFDFGAAEGSIPIICAVGESTDFPSYHGSNRGQGFLTLFLTPPAPCMLANVNLLVSKNQIANQEPPFVAQTDKGQASSVGECFSFCSEQADDGAKFYSYRPGNPAGSCVCLSSADANIQGKKKFITGVLDTAACDGSASASATCATPAGETDDAGLAVPSVAHAFFLRPGGSGTVRLKAEQVASNVLGIWANVPKFLGNPRHKKAFFCGVKMTFSLGEEGGYSVSSVGAGAKSQNPPAVVVDGDEPLWKRTKKATVDMGDRTEDAVFRVELTEDHKLSIYFVQEGFDALAFTSPKKTVAASCLIDAISSVESGMPMSVWSAADATSFPEVCGVRS